MTPTLGVLLTHPIQYYSPWFAWLARKMPVKVFYAHRQDPQGQARAGFSEGFDWDVPLLEGYDHEFLRNVATRPGLDSFWGCDTPDIRDVIRQHRFRAFLLFGWNKKTHIQAAIAARRSGIPVLVRLDSVIGKPSHRPFREAAKLAIYSALLPWAAHYLSPGARTDEYLRRFGVPPGRIHRLQHMVDVERFAQGSAEARSSSVRSALRFSHDVGESDFVFLFVGKMIEVKRADRLIKAFRELGAMKRADLPRLHLWMVGTGPLEMHLRQLAAGLQCSFLGFVNQSKLPSIYAAADCLVFPSDRGETWGLVVNEALACGIPAIVSEDAGCALELIEEGVSGWLLRTGDVDSLAEIMARAASQSRGLDRSRISAIAAGFSFESGCARFLEILDVVASVDQESSRRPT